MCIVLLPPGVNPITVNKIHNIKSIMLYHSYCPHCHYSHGANYSDMRVCVCVCVCVWSTSTYSPWCRKRLEVRCALNALRRPHGPGNTCPNYYNQRAILCVINFSDFTRACRCFHCPHLYSRISYLLIHFTVSHSRVLQWNKINCWIFFRWV